MYNLNKYKDFKLEIPHRNFAGSLMLRDNCEFVKKLVVGIWIRHYIMILIVVILKVPSIPDLYFR